MINGIPPSLNFRSGPFNCSEQILNWRPYSASGLFRRLNDRLRAPRPHWAGLAIDGTLAFLMSSKALQLFSTSQAVSKEPIQPLDSIVAAPDDQLKSASLGTHHLAIISNRGLRVYQIASRCFSERGPFPEFDQQKTLDCVAIHETDKELWIAIGTRQTYQRGTSVPKDFTVRRGITVYRFEDESSGPSCEQLEDPLLNEHDRYPFKSISFSRDGVYLMAVSHNNKCYACTPGTMDNLYRLPSRKYQTETAALGLTSATPFEGSAIGLWALMTTSPSTERFVNRGEFPYLAPVSTGPEGLRALADAEYDLKGLPREHPHILAGAVSDPPDYAALLERDGQIFLQSLGRDESGESLVAQGPPTKLPKRLKPHRDRQGVAPTSIRFCKVSTGFELVAIDPCGRVVRVPFERTRSHSAR